jgi:nucleotide-binding universal stress UspA family protein
VNVLAAIDFGDPSLEALRQARTLAHGVGASLVACHVLSAPPDLSALLPERFRPPVSSEDERNVRTALMERARTQLGLEIPELVVLRGTPYAEILHCADRVGARYVVVGSHGRTGFAHALLGSVAEQVVRHAHCSVLVARAVDQSGKPATGAKQPGVVLAATDLSDASLPVLAEGHAAAKRSGARLVAMTVIDWGIDLGSAVSGLVAVSPALPPPELRQQVHDALRGSLAQALAAIGAQGETRVLDGSPAAQIVTESEALAAELLVVGTRGRTGLARLALGNVAERVIRATRCPVLAVRVPT